MANIFEVLQELNIDYEEHKHPAVYTCEEADKFYSNIQGGKSKNLFLRNKKGDKHYLVMVKSSKKVDLKRLGTRLNESKLGFASPERLMKYLGLTSGAVSPFGLINDTNNEVEVIVDEDLMKSNKLHFHPNVNTATLVISRDDFRRFLEWTGNTIKYFKI